MQKCQTRLLKKIFPFHAVLRLVSLGEALNLFLYVGFVPAEQLGLLLSTLFHICLLTAWALMRQNGRSSLEGGAALLFLLPGNSTWLAVICTEVRS